MPLLTLTLTLTLTKIFCVHAGLSPDLNSPEQIKRINRPTDVPDSGGQPALRRP